MHLLDPDRPRLGNGRRTFINGYAALPRPEFWPVVTNDDGKEWYEMGMWLPVANTGDYASTYRKLILPADCIMGYLREYITNPEGFCEQHFQDQAGLVLDLRQHRKQEWIKDVRAPHRAAIRRHVEIVI